MEYRRAKISGGTYFLRWRRTIGDRRCAVSEYCLAEAIALVSNAAVILPEHLHCIWTLPEGIQIIRLQSCAAWVGKGTEGLRVFQFSQVWAVREV